MFLSLILVKKLKLTHFFCCYFTLVFFSGEKYVIFDEVSLPHVRLGEILFDLFPS